MLKTRVRLLPMECNTHTLVVQVAPLHHSSALLLKYRISPDNQQGWFLPNDDLHHLEHPEQAAQARREGTGRNRRRDTETRRGRVVRGKQSDLASGLRLSRIHSHDEHDAGKCGWRAEMVGDRRIAASRGICSPRMGKTGPSETCSGKDAASDDAEPHVAQHDPPESQYFIADALR